MHLQYSCYPSEMRSLLWRAYNSRSWAVVQVVQQRWLAAAHGPLAEALYTLNVAYTDS